MAAESKLPTDLPSLPNDWTWRPLGAFAEAQRAICYGIVQPGAQVAHGVPIIRVTDFVDGRIDTRFAKRVLPEIESNYSRSRLEGGEILLSLVGTLGLVAIAPPQVAGWNVARAVGVVPVGVTHRDFVAHALRSEPSQQYMRRWATTTVQATLNLRDAKKIPIPYPPLDEQRRIAGVLGALEDKIELNRKMNRTLEEMAQAIFKSWFIDFDGVPQSEMVDSELGPIPKGWQAKPLDSIATFLNGAACQRYPAADGERSLPVIKIRELNQGISDRTDRASMQQMPRKWWVEDGDLLFSWSGSLLVKIWTGGRGALNQHLFKVTSTRYPRWFLLAWVRHHLHVFQRIAAAKATTMGHIKRRHLTEALCAVPPDEVVARQGATISPLVDRAVTNELESRVLEELRDALLPQLISGEIRVPEAEKAVEAVL